MCMSSSNRINCFGFSLDLVSMETELTGTRLGTNSIFGSSAKPRSVRSQASDRDIEDLIANNLQGTVLPYVGVACLGAILFGFHLGVVNGA